MSSIKPKKSNDTQTDDNPIQPGYDAKFDRAKSLKNAEEKGNDESGVAKKNTTNDTSGLDNIRNAEETPSGSWNITGFGGMGKNSSSTSIGGMGKNSSSTSSGGIGKNSSSTGIGGMGKNSSSTGTGGMGNSDSDNTGPSGKKPKFSFFKKKGPFIGIGITIVGGGIGIMALTSPSLLIVQFKETMANKFNTQLGSMDVRNTKMLILKMGLTKGLCNSVASLGCKYSTMSKKQIANFEKGGIKVNYENKSLLGRAKPTSIEFDGKTIKPGKELNNLIKSDIKFRSALKRAFNPTYAGFADKIAKIAFAKLGISKKPTDIDGKTDEERVKKIQDRTKNAAVSDAATFEEIKPDDDNYKKPDGSTYSKAEADAINAERKAATEVANDLADAASSASSKGTKIASRVLGGVVGLANALKITGWMDNACTVYGSIKALGYAAKTIRALQLARYAMIFLNVADQIKAGTAKAEDVSYLGKILTTEVAASATSVKLGTATNSFGYRFAAYGERGKMSSTASQFMAGGGLTGKLIGLTSMINSVLKGSPNATCKTLKNPFVSAASFIGGLALFLIPGVNIAVGVKDAIQAAAGVAFSIAMAYLPALLQDVVAGVLIDRDTVGEAAGEAITSGSSGMMGTTAQTGGNAPLTPSQAVAYSKLNNNIAEQYAEEDRLAYSPLDALNSNTFMGKIVSQLIPYASNMSSLSGVVGSVTSFTTSSFASLTTQVTKAASIDDYTMCQDFEYRDLGLATDPYCNVTFGIPPADLEADPIDVANSLIASGDINPETGEPIGDKYPLFITNCIDRVRPLGDVGADFNLSSGAECLINNENKNFYVHYIDQRVQAGQDDESSTSSDSTTDPKPSDLTPVPTPPILSDDKLNHWIEKHANYNGGSAMAYKSDFREFLQLMGGDVFVDNLSKKHPASMLNITPTLSDDANYAETYPLTGTTNYRLSNWNNEPDRRIPLLIHEYIHSMDSGSRAEKYYNAAKADPALQWDPPNQYPMTDKGEFIASGFEWVVNNDLCDDKTETKRARIKRIDPDYYEYLATDFIPWMYKPQ